MSASGVYVAPQLLMMKKTLGAAFVVLALGLPVQLEAYPIAINNPGFEDPATQTIAHFATGWTAGGIGGVGVWNINDFPQGFWSVLAPEGDQIAFISDAPQPGAPATLNQVLGDNLAANTTYTLSGSVGHPIGHQIGTIWSVSLYAGGNLLATDTGTGPAGSFTTFNVVYDSTGSPFVGQALEIQIGSNKSQTGFDAISLEAASVPDGGLTALLLGMSMTALGWMRRKKA